MFDVGKQYRVWLERGGNLTSKVGEMVSMNNSLLVLNVEGVVTAFHLASARIAYVEQVDAEAEAARAKASGDRYINALS